MRRITIFAIAAILILSSCTTPHYKPTKTSLELQAIQAREFDAKKKVAFASVLSVFQDLGYIVKSSDLETGFITAKSPTQGGFKLFVGHTMKDTHATAFIEELRPGKTKVRLNFVKSTESSSGYGAKRKQEVPIEDSTVYNNAFVKIQEAIFIRTATE